MVRVAPRRVATDDEQRPQLAASTSLALRAQSLAPALYNGTPFEPIALTNRRGTISRRSVKGRYNAALIPPIANCLALSFKDRTIWLL